MRNLQSALNHPRYYLLVQFLTGAMRARKTCIEAYAECKSGQRVLDVGCGPGYVVQYLPKVDYVGIDIDPRYISYAQSTFGSMGTFHQTEDVPEMIAKLESFDLILLNGVLHHLDDRTAKQLLVALSNAIRQNGRLLTLDGCLDSHTSSLAKIFLGLDRGAHIRSACDYVELAENAFDYVETNRTNCFYVPYDSIVMVCRNSS